MINGSLWAESMDNGYTQTYETPNCGYIVVNVSNRLKK